MVGCACQTVGGDGCGPSNVQRHQRQQTPGGSHHDVTEAVTEDYLAWRDWAVREVTGRVVGVRTTSKLSSNTGQVTTTVTASRRLTAHASPDGGSRRLLKTTELAGRRRQIRGGVGIFHGLSARAGSGRVIAVQLFVQLDQNFCSKFYHLS